MSSEYHFLMEITTDSNLISYRQEEMSDYNKLIVSH